MSRNVVGILAAVAVLVLAIAVATQFRSESQLREESGALRQQLQQLSRVSADNHRLSNLVEQAKATQESANEQMQELLRLRAEVARLTQARQESNFVQQARLTQTAADQLRQMTALRDQMGQLSQDINKLRDDLHQSAAGAATTAAPAPAESAPAARIAPAQATSTRRAVAADDQQPLSIRMISTQSETFADKLKRSANAQEGETFPEVFGRFLQMNGVATDRIAGLVFDDRTGRVIVRAPAAILDVIERLTLQLDSAQ
jgi:hypothetical protein